MRLKRYEKPEPHMNAEPNPMPDPLKPKEWKHYYPTYTVKNYVPEPYKEPTF